MTTSRGGAVTGWMGRTVESAPGEGRVFRVFLLVEATAERKPPHARPSPRNGGKTTQGA